MEMLGTGVKLLLEPRAKGAKGASFSWKLRRVQGSWRSLEQRFKRFKLAQEAKTKGPKGSSFLKKLEPRVQKVQKVQASSRS